MKQQHGGAILGFIIGVVVGLAAALAVAVYVTKVPVPFVNKWEGRTPAQDVTESQKNKDWNPNAPLYGNNPVKPSAPASAPAPPAPPDAAATPVPPPRPEYKPAVSADPLGDLARARSAGAATEPFSYFVQVGAFRNVEDAESQRAKLSLSGVQAKVSEREQSGRAVFRVRVGPFDSKEEADQTKQKLDAAGLETALVRVQR